MDNRCVVIGGGIVGAAIALELQRRGADVVLVERDPTPQGASAFSFASISAFDERARDVYLLKSLGMLGWRAWAKRDPEIAPRWDGEIRWAESRDGADELNSLIGKAAGRGYPVRTMSPDELRRRLPHAGPGQVLAASFAAEDGQVDPVRVIDVLRRRFEDEGGRVVLGRASLSFADDTVEVRAGADRLAASQVIVAAGAETGALLEKLGWEIPMDPSPGLLAYTEPIAPMLTGVVYVWPASGPPVHLRQLDDGRVVVGERKQDHVASDPSARHAQLLLKQAATAFPALAGVEVDHFIVEWRPKPRDGMPIVGPLPGFPSVYVAAMHSGVTLAPAIAELVAQEVVDGAPAPRLESFRPERFGVHQADAYVSVEEAFTASEVYLG